jgi:TolB-like protein/tRNA A-37 threonylcarbamoyl transferase component Bud32
MTESGLPRLTGALADRYRIDRELRQGGMATVYLAEDLKHHRRVAIKVLRAELAAALGAERFLREIETTANLRHPHILPLYDSGEAGGFLYYVMPFIDGESLRDRLGRERPLAIDDALQITREVADALGYAHTRGVIHRDIKPENILLEGGHAVVADFGIAKAVSALDGGHLTQTGLAVGTPAYMSPEQVLADGALDGRSDLYSLGCVLFEMLTGEPPFAAATPQRTIARRLTESPPAAASGRPEIGAQLSGVIQRVLATEPANRPPTAAEFTKALTTTSTTRSALQTSSGAAPTDEGFWIAVLPFKYTGTNPDLIALAEGMSEEIVTGLSRFSYLRVMSRSATLRYAQESVEGRVAGEQLGARYVMEGSLRQAGTRLRVAVQLTDAASGAHLWAETYDRAFSPEAAFELQDDLVPRIVATVADVQGVLPHTMSEALRSRTPGQLSPYEAVLRSFGYFERVTALEHAAAFAGLELAVQNAPGYADGWAMLAHLLAQDYAQGFNVQPDPLTHGLAAAQHAVEAAPSNHLAHYALAQALFFRKELQAFRNAAARTLALNPMDSNATSHLGMLTACAGDWEQGCALAERATQLNPHHPGWYWYPLFFDAYRKRDYRGALDTVLKVNLPGHIYASAVTAAAYAQLGEREAARTALGHLLTLKPDFAATARKDFGKWFDAELTDHLIDGVRKAGLEIAPAADARAPTPVRGR